MTLIATVALLPQRDQDYLQSKELRFELAQAGNEVHLTLLGFPFPDAYIPAAPDLRVVLPPGYGNANPDMFWTRPTVSLRAGGLPLRADHMQQFSDGTWQRWSRHFEGAWRPGIDGIKTYLASIRRELARGH